MRRPSEEILLLKDDILDTAISVFAEKGYSAASLQDVANDLNISRSPIYYHFKNKTVLYEQAVLRYLKKKHDLYTQIDTQDAPFFSIIRQHLQQALNNTTSEPTLFSAIDEEHFQNLAAARMETGHYLRLLKKILITRAINKGELRQDIDVELMVEHLVILFYGFSTMLTKSSDGIVFEDIETTLDYIISILQRDYANA